jgi:anti-sigma regulatory factor (Ser/Thr protein kinase)
MTAARRFRCQPEAVTAARGFVRDMLRDQPPETLEAAELMTSELATNCVRHANTEFEVAIYAQGPIRIEVRDTGEGRPRVLSPASQDQSGRGLMIVEAMSESWGVIPASDGKTVWFTVAHPSTSSERGASAVSSDRGLDGADPGKPGRGHAEPHAREDPRGDAASAQRDSTDAARRGVLRAQSHGRPPTRGAVRRFVVSRFQRI